MNMKDIYENTAKGNIIRKPECVRHPLFFQVCTTSVLKNVKNSIRSPSPDEIQHAYVPEY